MLKTAIIAIAKNENQYINEWLDYHFNLGFDAVILCDNDDEMILKDVVTDNRVFFEDYTKQTGVQQKSYRDCYRKYRQQFDWFLIIDIDEFLVLENKSLQDFLSSFNEDVECVKLCYKHFTDNNELDIIDGNDSVLNRFKTTIETRMDVWTKQFVRNNLKEEQIQWICQHYINDRTVHSVDATGKECENRMSLPNVVYENAWINHYRTKTIGEFIRQKYFRGGINYNNNRYHSLRYFWETNEYSQEKEEYANKLIQELA